jgi:hypothetical protein
MPGFTIPAAVAFAWLLTPLASAGLVARSPRSRALVARHLFLCLGAGWLGLLALAYGATSLETGLGELMFLVGGPLGGLSVWSRSSGGDGPGGDDPPDHDDDDPPEWDWERFERDLSDYAPLTKVVSETTWSAGREREPARVSASRPPRTSTPPPATRRARSAPARRTPSYRDDDGVEPAQLGGQ